MPFELLNDQKFIKILKTYDDFLTLGLADLADDFASRFCLGVALGLGLAIKHTYGYMK